MTWDELVAPHGYCLANFDPTLVLLADLGNIMTSLAYVVAFSFTMLRMFDHLPRQLVPVLILGVLFVALCGVGHLLDALATHSATYNTYLFKGWWTIATGIVSWAFIASVFWATQRAGLRVTADED